MSDELDEFTSQLNTAKEEDKKVLIGHTNPNPNMPVPNQNVRMTPQQAEAMKKAQEMKAKLDATPLKLDALKGKVDLKWYGHAGFKVSFLDKDDVHRNIYVDVWVDNKDCPADDKKAPPNDVDLALVTNGAFDHSFHAPFLMMSGKREKRQIVCTSEVGLFYEAVRKIPAQLFAKMQPGGTKDFEWCKITMVHAESSSTCAGPQGIPMPGGAGVGFVINIPNHNISIYYTGATNVFSDMKIIDDLYKPDMVILPIGNMLAMGPREAAYSVKNFLPTPKRVVPMMFGTFDELTGTVEDFEKECKDMGVEDREIIHPKEFFGAKAIVE